MSNDKVIIICNGNKPKKQVIEQYLSSKPLVICANGGSKHALALGIIPDVVIGDQDSLPRSIKLKLNNPKVVWITHPKEKDQTDSQLAIEYALKKGFKEIIIFGIYGNRIDHFLAILLFLAEQKVKLKIVEGNQDIYLISKKLEIKGRVGDYLSLIPLKKDILGITTKGLLYSLKKENLEYGKTRGVSNQFIQSRAKISIEYGILLVIHTKKAL